MKLIKIIYHGCVLALVLYNTWAILQLNKAVTAIVAFLLRGLGVSN